MKSLAFRIDPANYAELSELAREENASPGQLARHFVLAALRNGTQGGDVVSSALPDLFAELDAIRSDLGILREAIATALETVLLNTTSATPEQIANWVGSKLRQD